MIAGWLIQIAPMSVTPQHLQHDAWHQDLSRLSIWLKTTNYWAWEKSVCKWVLWKNVVFCWSNRWQLIRIHIKLGQTDLGPTTALPFRGGNHLFNVAFGKQRRRTQFARGRLGSVYCLTNSVNLLCPMQKRCVISHTLIRERSKKQLCPNFFFNSSLVLSSTRTHSCAKVAHWEQQCQQHCDLWEMQMAQRFPYCVKSHLSFLWCASVYCSGAREPIAAR